MFIISISSRQVVYVILINFHNNLYNRTIVYLFTEIASQLCEFYLLVQSTEQICGKKVNFQSVKVPVFNSILNVVCNYSNKSTYESISLWCMWYHSHPIILVLTIYSPNYKKHQLIWKVYFWPSKPQGFSIVRLGLKVEQWHFPVFHLPLGPQMVGCKCWNNLFFIKDFHHSEVIV